MSDPAAAKAAAGTKAAPAAERREAAQVSMPGKPAGPSLNPQASGLAPARRTTLRRQLERTLDRHRSAGFARQFLLGVSLCALVWFATRIAPDLLDVLPWRAARQPAEAATARIAGTRFGALRPDELPSGVGGLKLAADVEKRDRVREAFEWSWMAYEQHALGADEFHPISHGGSNLTSAGGVGYTVVDSLDSLLVLGFDDAYKRAAAWCRANLDFDRDATFNTFETTIRLLGGLLSAHHLTSVHADAAVAADAPFFLERATDLADRLLGAFASPSGIPYSGVNLATRVGVPDAGNQGLASLAEAASVQLELKYLSHLTGDYSYWRAAEKVSSLIHGQAIHDGIAPIFINPQNGQFVVSEIRLGSRGDSYYEYLLKQYLQTDRQEPVYRDMYDEAMGGIKKHLVAQTKRSGLIYTHELHPMRHPTTGGQTWQIVPKQDHLVCFLGGSLILGVTEGGRRAVDWAKLDERDMEDFVVGKGIVESCVATHDTATGLAPEIAMFVQPSDERSEELDWYIKPNTHGVLIDGRNILRPETVESLFLAYRSTGDEKYRTWGWQIFSAFDEHARIATGGYASVQDVQQVPAVLEDRMETFWLSETLKYLYLLFDDSDHIPLDQHVFNTEAHILPVFRPNQLTAFSTS